MSSRARWTAADIPDQRGRVAVVTGANSGVGLEAARMLAGAGATVVLACRDLERADRAATTIRDDPAVAAGAVRTLRLDLASLASVREAAEQLRADLPRLDLLINNAGVMMPPRGHTEDGFELQFGVNHLGHFALTGLLLDRLLLASGSRVVTVSSNAHRAASIDFEDLNSERGYRPAAAYGRSKLANLLFTCELQRRLAAAGAPVAALAAHPGGSRTDLVRHHRLLRWGTSRRLRALTWLLLQDPPMGALPTLRAACDPAARGGEYYGPGRPGHFTGHPVRVTASARSQDPEVAHRLWECSERLTGVTYQFSALLGD